MVKAKTIKMSTKTIILKNGKTQVFEYALKRLASLGIKQNQRLLNGRALGGLVVHLVNVSGDVMFVLLEANTFWEYTNSIFISITASETLLLFILLILKSEEILKLVDFAQKIFEDSK